MISGKTWCVAVGLLVLCAACQKKATDRATTKADPVQAATAAEPEAPRAQPAAAAAAPATVSNPAAAASCESLCKRTVELKCKSTVEQCLVRCTQMAQLPLCPTEMSHVFDCLKAQALAHFECDDEGMPAIRSGFCEAEQAAFAKCVSKGAPSP